VPSTCRPYRLSDAEALVSLWALCGLTRPWNDPYRDIERKIGADADGLLVLEDDSRLIGAVMVGYDGHVRLTKTSLLPISVPSGSAKMLLATQTLLVTMLRNSPNQHDRSPVTCRPAMTLSSTSFETPNGNTVLGVQLTPPP
jgi:hypothetical protein